MRGVRLVHRCTLACETPPSHAVSPSWSIPSSSVGLWRSLPLAKSFADRQTKLGAASQPAAAHPHQPRVSSPSPRSSSSSDSTSRLSLRCRRSIIGGHARSSSSTRIQSDLGWTQLLQQATPTRQHIQQTRQAAKASSRSLQDVASGARHSTTRVRRDGGSFPSSSSSRASAVSGREGHEQPQPAGRVRVKPPWRIRREWYDAGLPASAAVHARAASRERAPVQ